MIGRAGIALKTVILAVALAAHAEGPPIKLGVSINGCPPKEVLAHLLGFHPVEMKWKVNLSSKCEVSDQLLLGSCWANSGVRLAESIFKKHGLMKRGEQLSVDFYTALSMKKKAYEAMRNQGVINILSMNGEDIENTFHFISHSGIVTDQHFSLPKIHVMEGGTPVERDIRSSVALGKQFEAEITKHRHHSSDLQATLDRYLGRPEDVRVRHVPAERLKQIQPKVLVIAKRHELVPIKNRNVEVMETKDMEKKIINSLRSRIPVQIGLLDHTVVFQIMNESGSSFLRSPFKQYFGLKDSHAVLIVGYGHDEKGTLWYLLQNSWGKLWAVEGRASASPQFLHNFMFGAVVLE